MANSKTKPRAAVKAKSTKNPSSDPDPMLVRPPLSRVPGTFDVLPDLDVLNAMTHVPDGQPNLMNIEVLLTQGIRCSFDRWVEDLPFMTDRVEIKVNNVKVGEDITFDRPLSNYTWPHEFSIPEELIGDHGQKNITYEVFYAFGKSGGPAQPTPVTVDRRDPNVGLRRPAPTLPGWVNPIVTPADLAANGDMDIVIPRRLDPQIGDSVQVYVDFPANSPFLTINDLPRTTADTLVTLSASDLIASGAGLKQINYIYTDRAGNHSTYPSFFAEFRLVTEDLPANLADPECPEAPLNLLDAQLNRAEIWIQKYDNAKAGDRIFIDFNSFLLIGTVDLNWPLRVPITWDVLRDGGITAPYTAPVFYHVDRDGGMVGPSNTIDVDVDLTSAGGRPEDPGPVNPDLPPVLITSSDGMANIIGTGHVGDAVATFDLYTGAAIGHEIQLWWNGAPCYTTPYQVAAEDLTRGSFELTVPESVIKFVGNGDILTWYSLTNGVNSNMIESLTTPVAVSAFSVDNLKVIEYPQSVPGAPPQRVITCAQGISGGIQTKILDAANLKAGDTVQIRWLVYGTNDFFDTNVSIDLEFDPVVIAFDHNQPGHPGELFTVPFETYIRPITRGRLEATYHVVKADGKTEGDSLPQIVLLSRLEGSGNYCGLPPVVLP